jgi:hypothetical protein
MTQFERVLEVLTLHVLSAAEDEGTDGLTQHQINERIFALSPDERTRIVASYEEFNA